jgi:hypothetical protein
LEVDLTTGEKLRFTTLVSTGVHRFDYEPIIDEINRHVGDAQPVTPFGPTPPAASTTYTDG